MLPRDWRLTTIRGVPLAHEVPRPGADLRRKEMVRACAFPGVGVVSMAARSFDPQFQRSWGYFPADGRCGAARAAGHFFWFIGSPSSRCRRTLFRASSSGCSHRGGSQVHVHDPGSPDFERRQRFRSVIEPLAVRFVPRGRGTSSIRLYEALAHGCVPVDHLGRLGWAPNGPDWDSFSIRWPEKGHVAKGSRRCWKTATRTGHN